MDRISSEERALDGLLADTELRIALLSTELESLYAARGAYQDRLAFLRQHSTAAFQPSTPPRALNPRTKSTSGRQGTIGLVTAVREALKNADGRPMHAREILPMALALGARTNARDRVGVVDLVAANLRRDGHPIEKVGPRTWAWITEDDPPLDERAS